MAAGQIPPGFPYGPGADWINLAADIGFPVHLFLLAGGTGFYPFPPGGGPGCPSSGVNLDHLAVGISRTHPCNRYHGSCFVSSYNLRCYPANNFSPLTSRRIFGNFSLLADFFHPAACFRVRPDFHLTLVLPFLIKVFQLVVSG